MKAKIIVKSIIFNRRLRKILIIQRCNSDPIGAGTWEGAGGNIEYGETPEQAIQREIREETGIMEIVIDRIAYVSLVSEGEPYLIIAYLCESQAEEVNLSGEHQAFVWADKSECMNMLPAEITGDFVRNNIFEYLGME